MGQFVTHDEVLATDGSGDGSVDIEVYGVLTLVDIVLNQSSSLDITLSRVLPNGTLATFYSTTSLSANAAVGRSDFTPTSLQLAGAVRVTLANAGNHTNAARVYLTVV